MSQRNSTRAQPKTATHNLPTGAAMPYEPALSPELLHWMHQQAGAGIAPTALKTAMVDAGWSAASADAALRQLRQLPQLSDEDGAAPASVEAIAQPAVNDLAIARSQPGPDVSAGRPSIEACGHSVGILVQQRHPPLAVFSQLLTPAECKDLMDAARPRLARSLTVETQTGGEEVNADRTSEGMFFGRGESTLIQQIEQRISALLDWPVECGEGLQVLRYGPGAEYKPHYDYFDPADAGTSAMLLRGGQRLATLILYLNTPGAGGATVFPQIGLDVAAQQGNGVFFRYEQAHPESRSLHGGAPVLQGEKWIATKWLRERHFE